MTDSRFVSSVPVLAVPDVVTTSEWYRDKLGFTIDGYFLDPPVFAIIYRDSTELFFSRRPGMVTPVPRSPNGCDVYLRVQGVDALADEFRERGIAILDGPVTREYNQREITIADCNGYMLVLGAPIR